MKHTERSEVVTCRPLILYIVAMPREASQETGRRGAKIAQRWLEATTFVMLPWNSYMHEAQCEITCLDGTVKVFDLAGYFLTEDRTPISVEVKHVSSEDHLREKFHEFLSVCYSWTAKRATQRSDDKREFMWVSWHPFGPMTRWSKLDTPDEMQIALQEEKNEHLLGGLEIDNTILTLASSRVWVLTFNDKQERLSLDVEELAKVRQVLLRSGPTL